MNLQFASECQIAADFTSFERKIGQRDARIEGCEDRSGEEISNLTSSSLSLDDQITTVTCRDAGFDLALRLSLDDLVTTVICLCIRSDLALEQIFTLFEIFESESGCDVTDFREQRASSKFNKEDQENSQSKTNIARYIVRRSARYLSDYCSRCCGHDSQA
jgi:hypothetical protein